MIPFVGHAQARWGGEAVHAHDPPHNLAAIANLIQRSALNFPDHRSRLNEISGRRKEESLQAYFRWAFHRGRPPVPHR